MTAEKPMKSEISPPGPFPMKNIERKSSFKTTALNKLSLQRAD